MKSLIVAAIAALSLAGLSGQAFAQSTEDLLRRLEAKIDTLANESAALKKENVALRERVQRMEGTRYAAVRPAAVEPTGTIPSAPSARDTTATSVRQAYAAVPAAMPFSWTGFYIGAHAGGAWGNDTWDGKSWASNATPGVTLPLLASSSSIASTGFLGGLQAGYNWQIGSLVYGIEGQFSFSDIEGRDICVDNLQLGFNSQCGNKIDWHGTIAGRFGVAVDRTLIYAKGGAAVSHNKYSFAVGAGNGTGFEPYAFRANIDDTRWGWMGGAGLEYAFAPNWSAKIEYNFLNFGREHYSLVLPAGGTTPFNGGALNVDVESQLHLIKLGMNYRFN